MFKLLSEWLERDGRELVYMIPGVLLGAALLALGIFELWVKSGHSSS